MAKRFMDCVFSHWLNYETENHNDLTKRHETRAIEHGALSEKISVTSMGLSNEVKMSGIKISDIKKNVSCLYDDMLRKESTYQNLTDQQKNISILIDGVKALDIEMKNVQTETVNLKADNLKLESNLKSAEHKIDLKQAEINNALDKLNESKELIAELKTELNEATKDNVKLKEKVAEIQRSKQKDRGFER